MCNNLFAVVWLETFSVVIVVQQGDELVFI
jgi:hypothetical protein